MEFIQHPKPKRKYDPGTALDEKWPLVIQTVSANPKIGTRELYSKFGSGIKNITAFKALCQERGLPELRKSLTEKGITAKQSSIQLTENAIEKFKKEREDKGYLFLGRIGEVVEKNLRVVERQAERIETGDDDIVDALLPTHLDSVSKLHKLGASVYGLDREASVEDQQKLQLNVIMNFDPIKAKKAMQQASAQVMEAEVVDDDDEE